MLSEKMRERRFYNVITEAPNYNYLLFPDISSIWLHQNGDSL